MGTFLLPSEKYSDKYKYLFYDFIGGMIMKLTEKESQIYQYILCYTLEHMYAPTVEEIGRAVKLDPNEFPEMYLMDLEAKGMIEVKRNSPRAIRLVGYSIVPNSMLDELNKLRMKK